MNLRLSSPRYLKISKLRGDVRGSGNRQKGESDLIFLAFLFLSFGGVDSHFFVVLLQGGQILTGFGELSFLHALANIPVNEGPLGVHEIELVIQTRPSLGNGGGVAQHAHGALDFGQVTTRNYGRRLVVDANLKTGGAPVDELDSALGLDLSDRGVDILRHNVTAVEQAAGHVLAMTRITFHHLIGRLEASVGDLGDGELFVVSLFRGNDGRVRGQREVDSGVRDQVGLELGQIHVESAVEAKRSRDGGNDLTDETIEIRVSGTVDVQVAAANIVNGFVVDHESTVGMLEGGVSGENRVVGLHDGRRHLRRWIDGELKLGLLSIIHGQPLHEKGGEAGSGATTERVEDEESLKSSALISQLTNAVQDDVHDLFPYRVVTPSVVISSVLFASDELFRMEKLTIGSSPDFVNDVGLQVDEDGARNVLSGASLGEESVERIVATADRLVGWHLSIGLDSVLEAVQLPAGIAHLDSGLADVDADAFPHFGFSG